jgi:hypothetical protein
MRLYGLLGLGLSSGFMMPPIIPSLVVSEHSLRHQATGNAEVGACDEVPPTPSPIRVSVFALDPPQKFYIFSP